MPSTFPRVPGDDDESGVIEIEIDDDDDGLDD